VLDLGHHPADLRARGRIDEVVAAEAATEAGDQTFDTIVSILHLAGVDDLPAELRAIAERLRPQGTLLFLEPVRQPGLGGRAQALVSPVVRAASGWRVDRDLPLAIRSNGFTIVDVDRVTMPAVAWPVRAFVWGAAHRSDTYATSVESER
jgi:SAM-dependent methyltransferase